MLLRDKLIAQGNRLFRKRGTYACLLAIPMLWLAFRQYRLTDSGPAVGWMAETLCLAVSLAGLAIRAYTVGCRARRTSGRNGEKGQVADALNTSGMYAITRNPLYLGNFLIALGVVMYFFIWWLVVIYILSFWLYEERIILAEEDFLYQKFGAAYRQWSEKTPVFFPRLGNWRPPEIPFSWRVAVKSEYQTATATLLVFFVLRIVGHVRLGHGITRERETIWLIALTLTFFMGVRLLRKHSRFLNVPGR